MYSTLYCEKLTAAMAAVFVMYVTGSVMLPAVSHDWKPLRAGLPLIPTARMPALAPRYVDLRVAK